MLTESPVVVEGGWSSHPRASLFDILSELTHLTALTLDLALKGEVEAPLERPQLQLLYVYLTADCQPARDYASLQSTTLKRLCVRGKTPGEESDLLSHQVNKLLPNDFSAE